MRQFFITALYVSIPISLFGFAAWLVYKQAPGWGWFLFAVVLVTGSIKWSVK